MDYRDHFLEKELFREEHEVNEEIHKKLKKYLRKKGKELQEEIGEGNRAYYPKDEIANYLGISKDSIDKRIKRLKTTNNRDFVIALCAAYGLDYSDTNDALRICDMPTLDTNSNREYFLFDYLNSHKAKPSSLEELDQELADSGFSLLSIGKRRRKNQCKSLIKSSFKEIRGKTVRVFDDYYENPYNSISTEYLPNKRCVAAVIVEDKQKNQFGLEVFSEGNFVITNLKDDSTETFSNINDTGHFKANFVELLHLVKNKKQHLDNILNDTLNYKNRFGANLKDDRIHLFYEEYNYAEPERHEYYLMEYINGNYQLSISSKSMFMQEYLAKEDFLAHYSSKDISKRIIYYSEEDLVDLSLEKKPFFYPELYKSRLFVYRRLKEILVSKLEEIRDRKIFINNFEFIWDNPFDVLRYYGIEKEFECRKIGIYDELFTEKESAFFVDDKGKDIEICFDEIKLAFELGFSDITQIIRVKSQKGSLKEVLK